VSLLAAYDSISLEDERKLSSDLVIVGRWFGSRSASSSL
jgi:hypothetical protein